LRRLKVGCANRFRVVFVAEAVRGVIRSNAWVAARLALLGVSGSYVGGEPVAEDGEGGQVASGVPLGFVFA
jgi:hypothetical protein